jgi:hypothetical protein
LHGKNAELSTCEYLREVTIVMRGRNRVYPREILGVAAELRQEKNVYKNSSPGISSNATYQQDFLLWRKSVRFRTTDRELGDWLCTL